MGKRNLTDNEISALQANSCWAEDWQRIEVSDDFKPNFFHRVMFYGDISLGSFTENVEVSRGFMKHSGVNNATLRNVTIGDNCLIENVSGFINNYVIGNDCIISNVCTMETTDGATYGEGNLISVLNEVGEGNLILYHGLTSQVAALMVKHFHNRALKDAIRRLIREEIERTSPEMATIGNRVKIVNTKEITNTVIYDDCEISGASRLSDCTIMSNSNASVYIGTGVICENSIISDGSSIINSVKMQDCFVGEACKLSNGFTAAGSVFFANSYMSNGEACAAFCGPFTASHHKSSLLIGGQFSFYNAGSATNFSNRAYALRHFGARNQDSQRCLHTDAGTHRSLLGMLRQTDVSSRHTLAALLLSHCLQRHHVSCAGTQPHYSWPLPRHTQMAKARHATRRRTQEHCQLRLAVAIYRGRDSAWQEDTGRPA